jgi:uroporphyrinogen decarboxylase
MNRDTSQGSTRSIVEMGEAAAKPILVALQRGQAGHVPVWLMRQAGRYLPEYREIRTKAGGFLELCFSPELAAEVTLQPVRRFGLDAAILFSDILVVPFALGQEVRFAEGEGPLLDPIESAAELDRLGKVGDLDRLGPVYETVERVASSLPRGAALIGFAGAPWTVASYMIEGRGTRDFAAVKAWAFAHEPLFARLIDLLVEATSVHLIRQIKAGADLVQIFDSWAGALTESEVERWCITPISAIVRRVKAACPGTPVIGFPRGIGMLYRRFVERTGVDGIGIDPAIPLDWAAAELQPLATVQGNLDPELLAAGGAGMRAAATRILERLGGGPFIFNLGHGVTQQTPPGHVAELVDLVHRWRG